MPENNIFYCIRQVSDSNSQIAASKLKLYLHWHSFEAKTQMMRNCAFLPKLAIATLVVDTTQLGSFLSHLIARTNRGRVCYTETLFTTLHFLCNLRMSSIDYNVTLHQGGKACKGQTL
jgi:hypothetical protein